MLSDSTEGVQLILDSEVVKECAIRNRDKREAPIHGEISHITFADLHMALYMRRYSLKLLASDHQHVVRSIEPDDFKSGLRHRDEDPASAAAQLEDRRSDRPSLLDIESNIPIDARSDLIVIDDALARGFRGFQSDRSSGSFESRPTPHPKSMILRTSWVSSSSLRCARQTRARSSVSVLAAA